MIDNMEYLFQTEFSLFKLRGKELIAIRALRKNC